MAKVTVPVSSIQEGDLIGVTGLNEFISSVNQLDGNLSGINGENVQNEGIEKRNLAVIPDSINHRPLTVTYTYEKTIEKAVTVFHTLQTLPTFANAKGSDMLLLVVSFDFSIYGDTYNWVNSTSGQGGFTASFKLQLLDEDTPLTYTQGSTTRNFTVGLLASQAPTSTVINNHQYRTAGAYYSVSNSNTATLFLGGRLDELMPQSFASDVPITFSAKLLGRCVRYKDSTSASLKGKMYNLSCITRLIKA
jgi:hypothetical protein